MKERFMIVLLAIVIGALACFSFAQDDNTGLGVSVGKATDQFYITRWHDDSLHASCWIVEAKISAPSISCLPDRSLQ